MGCFYDDFSFSSGKWVLKFWIIICMCVWNDFFVDFDIGV